MPLYARQGLTTIIAPYSLANNIIINNAATNTYTCTGVGGVPAAAKAVLLNLWFLGSSLGAYATITPHGTAESGANYPAIGTCQNTTVYNVGSCIATLDSGGQIDVKAEGTGNLTGLYLQMNGYIM